MNMNLKYLSSIIACEPLSHDFFQVSLHAPDLPQATPGQGICLDANNIFVPILDSTPPILKLIFPKSLTAQIHNNQLAHGGLQGNILPAPITGEFQLLLAEDLALSACLFYLKKYARVFKGLVLLGATGYFPFKPAPSRLLVPGMPPGVIAALPLLEDWGIASRLASLADIPGVFKGTVAELSKTLPSTLGGSAQRLNF